MTHGICYFVCGTVTDRRGFEYAAIGSGALPGNPPTYLDISPAEFSAESHSFSRIEVEGTPFVRYARYRGITPSDGGANRGAYIAVGFIVNRKMSINEASQRMEHAAHIFADVTRPLDACNAFPPNFDLARYDYSQSTQDCGQTDELSPVLLTDMLIQAINSDGEFHSPDYRKSLMSAAYVGVGSADADMRYFSSHKDSITHALDKERESLRRLAEHIVVASNHFGEIHKRWRQLEKLANDGVSSVAASSNKLGRLIGEIQSGSALAQSLATPEPGPTATTRQASRPIDTRAQTHPPTENSKSQTRQRMVCQPTVARDTPLTYGDSGTSYSHNSRSKQHHKSNRNRVSLPGGRAAILALAAASVVVVGVAVIFGMRTSQSSAEQYSQSATPARSMREPARDRSESIRQIDEKESVAEERAALDKDSPQSDKTP